MKELHGISASPGIVIGKVFLFLDDNFSAPMYRISDDNIDSEVLRLDEAFKKSTDELEALRKKIDVSEDGYDEGRLLDAHIMMLCDPEFKDQIYNSLRSEKYNAEHTVYQASKTVIEILDKSGDDYLRERTVDIYDVSRRLISNLMLRNRVSLADLKQEVIIVGKNLMPSDTLAMNKRMVKGIAMDVGGKTSHTAILARSFEIPAVLGLSNISHLVKNGDSVIIDGNRGLVIIDPNNATLKRYQTLLVQWEQRELQLLSLNELQAETKDGKLVSLKANIEVPEEVDSVISHGADGIGLYRSEFLFMEKDLADDEDLQYERYKVVLESMNGAPVTIRTLDVGGDKAIPSIKNDKEENPILGWRSIRFCLSNKSLFKRQLRALMRASMHGTLRIMFPMISGILELNQALEVVEEVKKELLEQGIDFRKDIPLGIMIEVPSAALTSDILAKKVDFFSIGTNDLIQYTIAVDRGNERVAYLYESFHLGILRLIKTIIDNAHNNNIPVSMCGEMAGDPLATVILLGLGLDSYSMSSFSIPEVKQIVRAVSISDAEALVGAVMELSSHREIDEYVRKWMNERFDFLAL